MTNASVKPDTIRTRCDLHRRTITSDELRQREDILNQFMHDLDDMIMQVDLKCDEIGGYFRAPGMRAEIRELLKDSVNHIAIRENR